MLPLRLPLPTLAAAHCPCPPVVLPPRHTQGVPSLASSPPPLVPLQCLGDWGFLRALSPTSVFCKCLQEGMPLLAGEGGVCPSQQLHTGLAA